MMRERGFQTIYQMLQGWAKKTPESIAFISPGYEAITYDNLFQEINSTIDSLRESGIVSNDRVAIMLPNGVELAAMVLAVSCAAISVPLNPLYREEEIESYLRDLRAKALVIRAGMDSPVGAVAERYGMPVIELIPKANAGYGLFTLRTSRGDFASRQLPDPEDIALILHTSGTTSKPKRVPLTHKNLCASAYSVGNTLGLASTDRCLGVMPLFHVHGLVGGMLASLAAGSSFIATSDCEPGCFFNYMEEFCPTWYTAVPTFHHAILSYAREHLGTIKKTPLRLIRSSSAPLPHKVAKGLQDVFKAPVIEAYGMTEASHQITSNPLPPGERRAGSVGLPTHTEVAIMDNSGNLITTGKAGEVVIRGESVTRGYEPDEVNQQSFINGWFRTGDIGYFDSGGYLFLTGRIKEVINRGGEKISPREVDDALLNHSDVSQAAAFAVPHPTLGEDVAAAVVEREPGKTTEAGLRSYLAGRLAGFKVPARVLIVERIPTSAAGKIQRALLAKFFAEQLGVQFDAPRNSLESLLANIYADVLKIPRVGINDNFFVFGGDSLRAMQVISRIRAIFSVNLPIANFFQKSTVAQLAEEVVAGVDALPPTSRDAVCAELGDISQAYSGACLAQRRYWKDSKG